MHEYAPKCGYKVVGDVIHDVNRIQDFAPYVAKIKEASPDTVVTGNWSNDLLLLMKAAGDTGLKVRFAAYWLDQPGNIANAGDTAIGHYAESSFFADSNGEKSAAFAEDFKGAFYPTGPNMAVDFGTLVFVVVVVGCLGSVLGAFVASLMIGLFISFAVGVDHSLADLLGLFGLGEWARSIGGLLTLKLQSIANSMPFLLMLLILLIRPAGRHVRLDGRDLAGERAFQIARAGIAYVPEEREIFSNITVEENMRIGQQPPRANAPSWTIDQMYNFFPQLKQRRTTAAGMLSGGEQQMLTMCRALLGNPRIILIDEPTEGLAPKIVEVVTDMIREIRNKGVSVLLVEQKLTIALRLSARVYVMGHGEIVFEGTPEDLRNTPEVRREWLEVS